MQEATPSGSKTKPLSDTSQSICHLTYMRLQICKLMAVMSNRLYVNFVARDDENTVFHFFAAMKRTVLAKNS